MTMRIFLRFAAVTAVLLASAIADAKGILAGTSHLQDIIRCLTGDEGSIQTLLPPNACPGHYDMRPADVTLVSGCDLLVLQSWQEKMPSVSGVIRAAQLPPERIRIVPVPGNWMLPETRLKAIPAVSLLLCEVYPLRRTEIETAALRLADGTRQAAAALQAQFLEACPRGETKVFANAQQAELARWLGLNVVQTFGRAESASVSQMDALSHEARANAIVLVVDNLQSGDVKLGESIANGCGAEHVVLSNFPGSTGDTSDWATQMRKNADALLDALKKWHARHG
jgi:zinc transport system substrate-binding protein